MRNELERLAWSGCRLLFVDYNDEQSRIFLCAILHDKSLCDSNIAQCVIPAKAGIPSPATLLDTCLRRYDKAFAGMTRRTAQLESFTVLDFSHTTLAAGGRARRPD